MSISSMGIKYLNIKSETFKLVHKTAGNKLELIGIDNEFLCLSN
jgi:hypothetical protein